jgi:hypothetical protein
MKARVGPLHTDGYVKIYRVENFADSGAMPQETLELEWGFRYTRRTVGMARYWQAMQAGAEIRHVIRIEFFPNVNSQHIAELEDGRRYRIAQIQYPEGVFPRVMDLTLTEVTENYDTN